MTLTKIDAFLPTNLAQIGSGLNRPECVLAARDGSLYTGDWTLGIARTSPDGTTGPAVEADLIAKGFLPNGIALTADGDFLFANLGEAGGVWRVGPRGEARPFATEVAGRPIPPANFVLIDGDRVWITVSASTRKHEHFTAEEKTGQILLVQDGKVTVAADGLTWTNELRISPDGKYLFVNETFACRTTRYNVGLDGVLSNPLRLVFPGGTFPDGMAFDAEGALWLICVVSNRLIRVAPDLTWTVVFEDIDHGALETIASAHVKGCLTRDQIVQSRGVCVSNLSSLAFGGPDLKTLYLGGLGISAVQVLRSPVAGVPMAHWQ
ncbi:MAG: SMP-30/gluconolactonase/LRE family protein [Rhodocyclaceae bacterium]|nr:SMP-30/gluconolactonase/LRE family protein [Rhodocyclaceae bacterium]